jgi:hypothetical protein
MIKRATMGSSLSGTSRIDADYLTNYTSGVYSRVVISLVQFGDIIEQRGSAISQMIMR